MDPTTRRLLGGAAGTSDAKTYIEDVFSTWLYTGNGSTQTITNGIDLSGKGGLVWIKNRNDTNGVDHQLFDTARGMSYAAAPRLQSNLTSAQTSTTNTLEASATGFNLGTNSTGGILNFSANTYASWTFRKAGKFFDVVTYTGDGGSQTLNHALGTTPGCVIIKRTDSTSDWVVWHRSFSLANIAQGMKLNTIDAFGNQSGNAVWSSTTPMTSTTFGVQATGSGSWNTNLFGATYVAYLFAHDTTADGLIQCGSFTTDGSGNATVNLGWEPQWVLAKRTDAGQTWWVGDIMRGMTGSATAQLYPNSADAEFSNAFFLTAPTATGFAAKATASATYIYIAIRRGPMKTPTDATKVFSALTRTGTAATVTISSLSFPADATLIKTRTATLAYDWNLFDRLRGATKKLATNATYTESTETNGLNKYDSINGYTVGPGGEVNATSNNFIDLNFRRAPGFFDVVAYTGTGSARTVSHNLGVVPELMIVKQRSSTTNWAVYSSARGNTEAMFLNLTDSSYAFGSSIWNNTTPTSAVFSVGTAGATNISGGTYIAYLFATCPGVSKVGSYTGTGTTKQIDCGFTSGSRLVLIKRTDSTGNWYIWDSARGIVSGNDPYLLLNSTAAEVTSTDYIDPLSSGFQISSTAPAEINASGGSYIFLAIS